MRRLARLLLAVSLLLASARVHADPTPDDRARARELANEGLTLFQKGDYPGAIDRFEKAEALVHAPPHLLYIARAHAKEGRLRAARDIYQRMVSEKLRPNPPKAFEAAQLEAGKELDALAPSIPRITVAIEGAAPEAARISVDGEAVTGTDIELDPGPHTVVAEADGMRAEAEIDLEPGARETVRLSLAGTAEPEGGASEIPLAPIIVMAAGGALLVVGGITGGLALSRAAELRELCPDAGVRCDPANEPLRDEAYTLATVSTTFFAVGGVAVAVGGGWLIYQLVETDNGEDSVALAPLLGPGFVGLRGSFR